MGTFTHSLKVLNSTMGHDGPWWTQLHWGKQLALEETPEPSCDAQHYPIQCETLHPSGEVPGHSHLHLNTLFSGFPPPLWQGFPHTWQNKTTTTRHWNFNTKPWCRIQWMVTIYFSTFITSLAFSYFFLSPSTSHYHAIDSAYGLHLVLGRCISLIILTFGS